MKIQTSAASGLAVASLLVLALAASPAQAGMQWKWRDANGATQYSDRPPPPGTPDSAILARPSASTRQVRVVEAASGASGVAPGAAPAATKTIDPELEARRKKAEEERVARQKADEDKQAKVRADNCERARGYERSLKDGMRIARTNDKGEREILDDRARNEELQRTQETIQSNCGK